MPTSAGDIEILEMAPVKDQTFLAHGAYVSALRGADDTNMKHWDPLIGDVNTKVAVVVEIRFTITLFDLNLQALI